MTNPIAVLLIIGSAVVGPIEAQQVPHSPCIEEPGSGTCFRSAESFPELCERAMREVGATEPTSLKGAPLVVWQMPNDGPPVTCIPVPAGYRK